MNEEFAPQIGGSDLALISFIAYLLIVIAIGIFAARFSSSGINEFFIAGRRMNRIVVALSAVVSGRSAWLLLGVTGMAYSMGISAVWAVAGYIIAELFLFLFYARRLRRFSDIHDCITVPDFFAARLDDRSGSLRIVLSLIIMIFMLGYVAAQFVGGGKAFAAGFGLAPDMGILITAAIVLLYTILGGFLAVSLTDVLQAFFMIIALVLLPLILIIDQGGPAGAWSAVAGIDPSLIDPVALSAGAAIGFIGIGLGSPGNPHIIARYMSIDDPEQLRISAIIGTVWNILMAAGALFIGLLGRIYFPDTALLPQADTEQLYPLLAQDHLHPVLFGVVIASIFAAIMSTADSQLLVAASSIVRDIYQKTWQRNVDLSQKKLVILSRITVFGLVLIALIIGWLAEDLVFWLVLFAWAGLGAALGPTSILALFWERTTHRGVMAGLISGTVVTLIWYYIPGLKQIVYELVPAFLISLLVTVLVSLHSESPPDAERLMKDMK